MRESRKQFVLKTVSIVAVTTTLALLVIALTTDFSEDSYAVSLAAAAAKAGGGLAIPKAADGPGGGMKAVAPKKKPGLNLGSKVWGYEGSIGPSHWGGKCGVGLHQSPIDIPTDHVVYNYQLVQPDWEYEEGRREVEVLFNGHTVEVTGNYATLSFARHEWKLQQYHFRTPSEHRINNAQFPVEMQMVHRNAEGRTLIVSWFFDTSEWAPAYIPLLADDFPATFDGSAEYNHPVPGPRQVEFNAFIELLVQRERKGHMFYTYEGSMTQPPCTEGVTWVVMTEMIGIARNDVKKLKGIEGKNNRPVQAINGRKIFKSFAAS